jgi:hypothetical protein
MNASISALLSGAAGAQRRSDLAKKGSPMPIEFSMFSMSSPAVRWRHLITGECRSAPPRVGELDWVEVTVASHCPD